MLSQDIVNPRYFYRGFQANRLTSVPTSWRTGGESPCSNILIIPCRNMFAASQRPEFDAMERDWSAGCDLTWLQAVWALSLTICPSTDSSSGREVLRAPRLEAKFLERASCNGRRHNTGRRRRVGVADGGPRRGVLSRVRPPTLGDLQQKPARIR